MIGIVSKAGVYVLGAALLASLAFGGTQCSAKQRAQVRAADAEAKLSANIADYAVAREQFQAAARAAEQRHSADMARIGQQHQQESKDASDRAYDRAVADVRAGRLRGPWTCLAGAKLSGTSGATPERDGPATDGEQAAARVFRIGAEADAQLAACQAVIMSDRTL